MDRHAFALDRCGIGRVRALRRAACRWKSQRGRSEVLAYAQVHGAIAVIDDGAGRKAARDAGVELRPTLALLCQAIREGLLTVRLVSDLADHLLETKYRLPFKHGGFEDWANENGLVPPHS